jgi:hypothetical protein
VSESAEAEPVTPLHPIHQRRRLHVQLQSETLDGSRARLVRADLVEHVSHRLLL